MSNKKSDVVKILDQYQKDLIQEIAESIFNIADMQAKTYGEEFRETLVVNLLTTYIATMVNYSLILPASHISSDQEEQYKQLSIQFAKTKSFIELAVEEGLTAGMHAFNPDAMPEYSCVIECVDPGIDKKIKN